MKKLKELNEKFIKLTSSITPIFILLLSCSSSVVTLKDSKTDPEFEPYIQEFKYILGNSPLVSIVDNTKIIFGDLEKNEKYNIAGVCKNMLWTYPTIEIDKTTWKTLDFDEKNMLIVHELGHCVCKRLHTELSTNGFAAFFEKIAHSLGLISKRGYLKDNCPVSLMHPTDIQWECNRRHNDYYIKEMREECGG